MAKVITAKEAAELASPEAIMDRQVAAYLDKIYGQIRHRAKEGLTTLYLDDIMWDAPIDSPAGAMRSKVKSQLEQHGYKIEYKEQRMTTRKKSKYLGAVVSWKEV